MQNENIDLTELMKATDDIINKFFVAKISFRGITPWWGGDYEGYTSNIIDEDQIVGRLRWFLKTIYNRFCVNVNNLNDYTESESKVSKYLGGTDNKSTYILKVDDKILSNTNPKYSNLKRVILVTSGRENKDKYAPLDIKSFNLKIYRSSNDNKYDKVIINGIMITLAFLGIGKGANRGFGRFIPNNCKDLDGTVCDEIIKGDVNNAFNKFYNLVKEVETCNNLNQWTQSYVPLAPLPRQGDDSIIETSCINNNIINILDIIQNSVLKSNLKIYSYNTNNPRNPGPFIHTWIYGLPRHSRVPRNVNQKNMHVDKNNLEIDPNKVKSLNFMGYFDLENNNLEIPRRQSMFIISPVFINNTYKIYILPFLSLKDNEEEVKKLVHKGIHLNKNFNRNQNQGTIHLVRVQDILNSQNNSLYNSEKNIANIRQDLSYGIVKDLISSYEKELLKIINNLCEVTTSYKYNKTSSQNSSAYSNKSKYYQDKK